jgi:radical SAM protein (TIGR01212 family)
MGSVENINDYPWGHEKPYNDFSSYFKQLFDRRIQKISIDAGFTCPNRDGTKGKGGCSFCDNKTFNPSYCLPENSVTNQLDQGIAFFKERYKTQKYLAYFQAFSNTYAPLDQLRKLYEEALSHPDVIGLVIGTRPDCLSEELLEYLDDLSKTYFISLELGVESTLNTTLERINRGHSFEEVEKALNACKDLGFKVGLHLILGLPGESEADILTHAGTISSLPFHFLKLHQLQIIRGTKMAAEFQALKGDFLHFTADQYVDLTIRFLELLNSEIIVDRFISQSPLEKLISPRWGLKNYQFTNKLVNEMDKRNTWQGRLL